MSAELEARLQRLGAQMLDAASPVTAAEAVRHRLRLDGDRALAPVTPRTGHHGAWMLAGLVAAASLLVVGLGVVTSRTADDEPQREVAGAPVSAQAPATDQPTTSAPAATTSAAAPAAPQLIRWPPRVLLDSGWDVITANERSIDEGYMTFSRDGVTVFVGWYRGEVLADEAWYEEKGFTAVGSGALLGHPVTIYSGPQAEGAPTQGLETSLVIDAASLSVQVMSGDSETTLSAEEYSALLAGVRQVETTEWEAALPERVVTPAERPAVVEEILTDVPIPEDFDPQWGNEDLTQDRTELAAELANSVACAWLNRYFTATEGSPQATGALDAIESIPSWPVSEELAATTANPVEGEIPPSSAVIPFLTVDADGTITYGGEPLDGYFAAGLCDPNAVG